MLISVGDTMNYISRTNFIYLAETQEGITSLKNVNDYEPFDFGIDKVLCSKGYNPIERNNYPTVIGAFGIITQSKDTQN